MAVQEVNLEMVDLLRPYFLSKPQAGETIIIPGTVELDPLYVDNIYEKTTGHGVNVDGVLIKDTTVDLNGTADALILDADGDTTISAPTANQIDVEIAGADDFTFTANTFTALSGSTIKTDTIGETTAAAGVTIDSLLIKDGKVDLNGVPGALIMDADGDTTIGGKAEDDNIEIVIAGADDFRFSANLFQANTGSQIRTDTINETSELAGVTVSSVVIYEGTVDVNGTADAIILDADGDTTISAPTANQIDFETGGGDRMTLTDAGLAMAAGGRVNEFSTDGTLAGNSDTALPTEKAVKTYVDLRAMVGEIKMWATDTAPTGWLLCYGQAISRTTYSALFAVIGTAFGTGDGSTTFNMPDFRGRVPLGQDDMGGTGANRVTAAAADSIGGSGGAETHTLTVAEMPSHAHQQLFGLTAGALTRPPVSANLAQYGDDNTGSTGGDGAHNNLQPYLTINFIIFAAA